MQHYKPVLRIRWNPDPFLVGAGRQGADPDLDPDPGLKKVHYLK
jgi:hypothetical protein